MSSSVEPIRTRTRSRAVAAENWNRKLHYYLGLYFLFFLWLFSLTGLLLNHPQWVFVRSSEQRRETRAEQAIQSPHDGTDLSRAREVMRQLNLTGEVSWPAGSQKAGWFEFAVSRPSDASQVRVDLAQHRAFIQHFENNGLSTFRIFHTFSGSRFNAPGNDRDWIVTTIWVLAMDALAGALIVMVLGSYYMWYRLKRKRLLGVLVLAAGVVTCALFAAGFLSS